MSKVILSEEELVKKCSEWQEHLGLAHWRFAIRICRGRDMPEENTCGNVDFVMAKESGLISIIDSSDYPESPFEQDMEETLVHELLHVAVEAFSSDLFEPEAEHYLKTLNREAFIDRTARFMVSQQREIEKLRGLLKVTGRKKR